MDSGFNTELWLVLAVMLAFLIFAIAGVVIFFRVWRKERGQDRKE